MVPKQVKTQKIQAGLQVSRVEDKDVIFSIRSALEDFIMLYFVLVRNIVSPLESDLGKSMALPQRLEKLLEDFSIEVGVLEVLILTYLDGSGLVGALVTFRHSFTA
ncbi:hypothetical protein Tco_0988871 [Tanacetum coccineum]|uniref:Uncharacterized protein n=1 Tax=Tanacetum coccineum TaxID=301880 RepID=A0ABQ5ETI5_9ASTR